MILFGYYYIEKNKDELQVRINNLLQTINNWINSLRNNSKYIELNKNNKKDTFYEENDLVDIKIKSDTINSTNGSNKDNFNNFTTDYGGI